MGLIGSAGIALLVLIVAAMPIDLLMNIEAFALLSLAAIGGIGWLALQRQSTVSGGAGEAGNDYHSE